MKEKNGNRRKIPLRGIIALAVCVAVIAGIAVFAAKRSYNPQKVLTVNGKDVSCGTYLYYQQAELINLYADVYKSTGRSLSSAEAILKYKYDDGSTIEDRLKTAVDESLREAAYVDDILSAKGLELNSNQLYYYNYLAAEDWAQNSEYYLANGIGYDSFLACYIDKAEMAVLYQSLYQDENSEYYITDETIREYFDTEYLAFDLITMPSTNGDGDFLSEDELAAVSAVAEKIRAALAEPDANATEVFDSMFADALTAANRNSEIKDSTYSAYLRDGIVTTYTDSSYNYVLLDELRNAAVGDTGIVKYTSTNGGNYLFVYLKRAHNAEGNEWEAYKDSILDTVAESKFEAFLAEGAKDYTTQYDAKAVKYYSPYNIDINH